MDDQLDLNKETVAPGLGNSSSSFNVNRLEGTSSEPDRGSFLLLLGRNVFGGELGHDTGEDVVEE